MGEAIDYPLEEEASYQVTEGDGRERDKAPMKHRKGGDKEVDETKERGVDPKANP